MEAVERDRMLDLLGVYFSDMRRFATERVGRRRYLHEYEKDVDGSFVEAEYAVDGELTERCLRGRLGREISRNGF